MLFLISLKIARTRLVPRSSFLVVPLSPSRRSFRVFDYLNDYLPSTIDYSLWLPSFCAGGYFSSIILYFTPHPAIILTRANSRWHRPCESRARNPTHKRKRKAERPTVQRIAPARFRRPSFSLSFPSYHFLFGFGFCGFPFRVKSSTPPPVRGAFVDLSYGIIHRKMPTFVYFHHMRCCCSISRDDLIFLFEFTFIIAWSAVGLE